jgi:hypothetical protein
MSSRLVTQAQTLLDALWILMRRMDPSDPLSEQEPYNDYRREQVEDLIGRAQRRLERRRKYRIVCLEKAIQHAADDLAGCGELLPETWDLIQDLAGVKPADVGEQPK